MLLLRALFHSSLRRMPQQPSQERRSGRVRQVHAARLADLDQPYQLQQNAKILKKTMAVVLVKRVAKIEVEEVF
jgi:hypothetical protein